MVFVHIQRHWYKDLTSTRLGLGESSTTTWEQYNDDFLWTPRKISKHPLYFEHNNTRLFKIQPYIVDFINTANFIVYCFHQRFELSHAFKISFNSSKLENTRPRYHFNPVLQYILRVTLHEYYEVNVSVCCLFVTSIKKCPFLREDHSLHRDDQLQYGCTSPQLLISVNL